MSRVTPSRRCDRSNRSRMIELSRRQLQSMEAIMRKSLYPVAAAAVAVLALAADTKPAEAMVIYPWCAHYSGRMGGAPNCGFVTYAQCRATISGLGGSCMQNP